MTEMKDVIGGAFGAMPMRDLVFISNGHGEDRVACNLIDALRADPRGRGLTIAAWPMVGDGKLYVRRGLPIVGSFNTLPGEGMATLSWPLFFRDLAAGWISTHWRQYQSAAGMQGSHRLAVAVGDIVPIVAAMVSRTPFVFIGCAKSAYYSGWHAYTPLERWLLRRYCRCVYPRDAKTSAVLAEKHLPVKYLGNPMMDQLESSGEDFGASAGSTTIALLPGSRSDAAVNAADLLAIAAALTECFPEPERLLFLVAAAEPIHAGRMRLLLQERKGAGLWRSNEGASAPDAAELDFTGPHGARAKIIHNRFSEVLHASKLTIGMAGTANEQAVGLGLPLVAVPTMGAQGPAYLRMKMRFFGESAIAAPRDPDRAARMVAELLGDPVAMARMAAAGRERMGVPGASQAIAQEIIAHHSAVVAQGAA